MKISAQKLNKGMIFSKEMLQRAVEFNVRTYYRNCEKLYNLGYNYAMYDFDEKKFLKALRQEFPTEFKYFVSKNTGKMDFSIQRVEYVLEVSENTEFKNILALYHDILNALDLFECAKILWTRVKFKKSSDTKEVKPRYVITSKVDTSGIADFHREQMVKGVFLEKDEVLVKESINETLYKTLLLQAGIPEDEVEKYYDSNRGITTSNLTYGEECRFVNLIMEGSIELDGDYGKVVQDFSEKYYTDFYDENNTKTSIVSLTDKIFTDALPEYINILNEYREQNPDDVEAFISSSGVYFKRKGFSKFIFPAENYIGTCVLDAEGKTELDKTNNLLGYSGEYISEGTLHFRGWRCEMPPVRLYAKGKLYNFYPSFLVEVDDDINYEPILGYGVSYDYFSSLSLKTVDGGIRFDKDKDSTKKLAQNFKNHLRLTQLESEMMTTLCCVDLNMIPDGLKYPNELNCKVQEVTDDYVTSCKKVADLFTHIQFKN